MIVDTWVGSGEDMEGPDGDGTNERHEKGGKMVRW